MLNSRPRSSNAFTLVELLLVITIISILSAIVFVGFNNVQKHARDTERATDVQVIMAALEKYYDKHGEYPTNDAINTTNSPSSLSNFSATKTLMPTLKDDDLTGPGGYQFYAGCINTSCTNTSTLWRTHHSKQYYYSSRLNANTTGGDVWFETAGWYGSNTGWGCRITTYYNDPGFFLAWRSEETGIWTFKRSNHGNVVIEVADGGGPIAPQTCTFS